MWTSSSSGIKYLASLAGSFMRPVQERLQDRLSVKDFGAQGDGGLEWDSATSWNIPPVGGLFREAADKGFGPNVGH